MAKKDDIVRLKKMHLSNSEIALVLQVSRQYVSHALKVSNELHEGNRASDDEEFVSSGRASRLLGVSPSTIRHWADEGKITYFRINIGRRDRRFSVRELTKLMIRAGQDRREA